MRIIDKFILKAREHDTAPAITIAFLGDSVTEGCFGIYTDEYGKIQTYVDSESVYHHKLKKIFLKLYPTVPLNIINAGISGNCSWDALKRLDVDVLRHSPDLCVISFSGNDAFVEGEANKEKFRIAVKEIVSRLQERDTEVILMTSHMNCTKVSCHLTDSALIETAEKVSENESNGTMAIYAKILKGIGEEMNVPVCDCYSKWRALFKGGVDITSLLANHINHPDKDMHWLTAFCLAETMFEQ